MALDPRQAMILGADPARSAPAEAAATRALARRTSQHQRAILRMTGAHVVGGQPTVFGPTQLIDIPADGLVEIYLEAQWSINSGMTVGTTQLIIGLAVGAGGAQILELPGGGSFPNRARSAPNSPQGANAVGVGGTNGLPGMIVLPTSSDFYAVLGGALPVGQQAAGLYAFINGVGDLVIDNARCFVKVGA